MDVPISKSNLTEAEARLIELFQTVNFGRVEHLQIRGGIPVLNPPPEVVRTRKMGSSQAERPELDLQDFWLKQPVIDLIETIRKMGDGEILSITIQHGLPHIVEIAHDVSR